MHITIIVAVGVIVIMVVPCQVAISDYRQMMETVNNLIIQTMHSLLTSQDAGNLFHDM
jgi:hypothetical protein